MRARALFLSVMLLACGNPEPAAGTEGGPCRSDGTCDAPLLCLSGAMCVVPGPTVDGGVDAGVDAGSDAGSDAGVVERRTYVVDDIVLPIDSATAGDLGRDLDGDGAVDNQLGSVIAALRSAGGDGVDVQGSMSESIARGEAILLLEVLAPSFVATTSAQARLLRGEMPMPTPCEDASDPICRHHLEGTGSFGVTLPAPARAAASIDAMRLEAGPSTTAIPLSLFGETPAWVPLIEARVVGPIATGSVGEGTITGAVLATDVDGIFVPALHASISATIAADCPGGTCVKGSTGETLLGIFDDDGDGMVPIEELRASSLLMTLLRADVDLRDAAGAPGTDGTDESLSVGIGFHAVLGSFDEP